MEWPHILNNNLNQLNLTDLNEFKSLNSNYERVCFVLNKQVCLKGVDHFLNSQLEADSKSSDESNKLRAKGNVFYAQKNNRKAFNFYTKALSNAPNNKSLILAYSNRSALFYDEHMYQNSLQDTRMILRVYNQFSSSLILNDSIGMFNLLFKVFKRQLNCLSKLGLNEELSSIRLQRDGFYSIIKSSFFKDMDEKALHDIDTHIDVLLSSKSDPIQTQSDDSIKKTTNYSISDCVRVAESVSKGRHCIATRDIKPGECLIRENAYSAILLPEYCSDYCQTCFKHVRSQTDDSFDYLNLEFCSDCANIVYCSYECKQANQFHKMECKLLKNLLHNLGIAHLAYRIVCTTRSDLIDKYATNEMKKLTNQVPPIEYGRFDNQGEVDYIQVFYLVTHEKETYPEDLFKYALTSILLAKCYLKFGAAPIDRLGSVSCLILRHLLQTICNAHAITQLSDNEKANAATFGRDQVRFATAIYPRVSLLNHSCDSNVMSSFDEDSSVIEVRTGRTIKCDEEIFNCYGPHHLKMNVIDRRQSLLDQYRFECVCQACNEQLRTLHTDTSASVKCFSCKSGSTLVSTIKNELVIKCLDCNKATPLAAYNVEFDQCYLMLENTDFNNSKLNEKNMNNLEEALRTAGSYLLINTDSRLIDFDTFKSRQIKWDQMFKFFYLDFSKLLDGLVRLNCNCKQFLFASKLMEANVKNLEFIYTYGGVNESSHVELSHELFKLAEIQCNCGQFELAFSNLNRAISIGQNVYTKESKTLREFHDLRDNILKLLN